MSNLNRAQAELSRLSTNRSLTNSRRLAALRNLQDEFTGAALRLNWRQQNDQTAADRADLNAAQAFLGGALDRGDFLR